MLLSDGWTMHTSVFTGGGEGRAAEAASRMVGELKYGGQDPSVFKCVCVCINIYIHINISFCLPQGQASAF